MTDKLFVDPTPAVVELFGHQVIAGTISQTVVAGTDMLRVDVPETDEQAAYTKLFGGGAIYAITPTDEKSMLHAVQHLQKPPINKWTIPHRSLLESPEEVEEVDGDGVPF